MSLHGDIRVNGDLIGSWSARRRERVPAPDYNTYDVEVTYIDPDSNTHGFRDELVHRFGTGAMTLAAEVLTLAAKHLPPRADADSPPSRSRLGDCCACGAPLHQIKGFVNSCSTPRCYGNLHGRGV